MACTCPCPDLMSSRSSVWAPEGTCHRQKAAGAWGAGRWEKGPRGREPETVSPAETERGKTSFVAGLAQQPFQSLGSLLLARPSVRPPPRDRVPQDRAVPWHLGSPGLAQRRWAVHRRQTEGGVSTWVHPTAISEEQSKPRLAAQLLSWPGNVQTASVRSFQPSAQS